MSQYLGDISAYALAVSQGYTGTEEEYAELMASYATVGQTAVTAAQTATTKASEAATSATTATNKASEATTAAQTATTKAAEASTSASTATSAKDTAVSASQTATSKASEATTAAATATSAKTDAVAANTAAQSAKTAAQTAQTGAETAAASVEASAAQIATNAEDISQLKSEKADVSELLKAFPTDSAQGAIASFTDGAELPLKSLTVDIEPIQDLHGYDNPWPAGGGKNLLAPVLFNNQSQIISNSVTLTVVDQKFRLSGTASSSGGRTTLKTAVFTLPAGTYTLSRSQSVASVSVNNASNDSAIKIIEGSTLNTAFTISDETSVYIGFGVASGTAYNETIAVQLESGSTATTYAPYSNICPISGHTQAVVTRTGKNLFDSNFSDYTKPYNYYICPIKLENGKRYKLKAELVGTTITGASFGLVKSGNRYEEFVGPYYVVGANGDARDFNITVDDTFTAPKLIAYVSGENQFNEALSNYNVMLMPYEQADYEPYQGESITINLGQTVYGGTLDVLSGELVIDRAMVDLGSLNWQYSAAGTSRERFTYADSKLLKGSVCLCDRLQTVTYSDMYNHIIDNSIAVHPNAQQVEAYVSAYTDINSFRSAMTGSQFCYELATPITVTLTPNELSTLLGANNIWSDAGEVTAEYRADPTLFIQRKIAEALS